MSGEEHEAYGPEGPKEGSEVQTPYSDVATVVRVYGDGTATVRLATGQYETYYVHQLSRNAAERSKE